MSAKLLQQIFKELGKLSECSRRLAFVYYFRFGNPKLEVLKKVFKPAKDENTQRDTLIFTGNGIFGFTAAIG